MKADNETQTPRNLDIGQSPEIQTEAPMKSANESIKHISSTPSPDQLQVDQLPVSVASNASVEILTQPIKKRCS